MVGPQDHDKFHERLPRASVNVLSMTAEEVARNDACCELEARVHDTRSRYDDDVQVIVEVMSVSVQCPQRVAEGSHSYVSVRYAYHLEAPRAPYVLRDDRG